LGGFQIPVSYSNDDLYDDILGGDRATSIRAAEPKIEVVQWFSVLSSRYSSVDG
jgi:hypothetical protein